MEFLSSLNTKKLQTGSVTAVPVTAPCGVTGLKAGARVLTIAAATRTTYGHLTAATVLAVTGVS